MSRDTGVANFDISATGDLAYIPGQAVGGARTLFWVDRSGRAEQLPLPPRSYLHPRLSPDATRLAIEVEGSDKSGLVFAGWPRNRLHEGWTRTSAAEGRGCAARRRPHAPAEMAVSCSIGTARA